MKAFSVSTGRSVSGLRSKDDDNNWIPVDLPTSYWDLPSAVDRPFISLCPTTGFIFVLMQEVKGCWVVVASSWGQFYTRAEFFCGGFECVEIWATVAAAPTGNGKLEEERAGFLQ